MKRSYGTLTGNTTVTVSLSNDQDLLLVLTQGGTGSYTVTWSGVDKWFTPAGTAPTLKTAVGASDGIQVWRANGVNYALHLGDAGPAGSTGSTGAAGIAWRGAYNAATTYSINDAVYYSGSSYIALQASSTTNAQQPNLAPAYWSALTAGGGSGSAGETVDNFTRADNANISTGAPNGITYTTMASGTAAIASNLCHDTNTANAGVAFVASTTLTSSDHHCQVTVGAFTASGVKDVNCGAYCRLDGSATRNGYMAFLQVSAGPIWKVNLLKWVSGTPTTIATGTSIGRAPQASDTVKLVVSGTTITGYFNGAQNVTVTDSAITTGTHCGLHMNREDGTVDVSLSELRFGT